MLFLKQMTSQLKVIRTGIFHERVAKIRPTLFIFSLATLVIWLGLLPNVLAGDDQLRYQRFMAEQNRYGKPRPRTGDRESGYAAEHMIRNNLWFVDELKSPPTEGHVIPTSTNGTFRQVRLSTKWCRFQRFAKVRPRSTLLTKPLK